MSQVPVLQRQQVNFKCQFLREWLIRSLLVIYKNQNNWSQKFWREIILIFISKIDIPKGLLIYRTPNTQSCRNRRHSTQLFQVQKWWDEKWWAKKTYGAWEHAREKSRNVHEYEEKGKNEVPNVPTLSSLLHKCSSTSHQVNMKQDFVCKGCFCVFAISFHTSALNLGKTATESHKNCRNTNYKKESLSSTPLLTKFGCAQVSWFQLGLR